eukprot:1578938-Prymnesium_polylepis.1
MPIAPARASTGNEQMHEQSWFAENPGDAISSSARASFTHSQVLARGVPRAASGVGLAGLAECGAAASELPATFFEPDFAFGDDVLSARKNKSSA